MVCFIVLQFLIVNSLHQLTVDWRCYYVHLGSDQKADNTHREQAGEERSFRDIQIYSAVHGWQAIGAWKDWTHAVQHCGGHCVSWLGKCCTPRWNIHTTLSTDHSQSTPVSTSSFLFCCFSLPWSNFCVTV